jgi:hypothetical protein
MATTAATGMFVLSTQIDAAHAVVRCRSIASARDVALASASLDQRQPGIVASFKAGQRLLPCRSISIGANISVHVRAKRVFTPLGRSRFWPFVRRCDRDVSIDPGRQKK